ncbi:alpha/beta hydrolase [Halobacillus shinanisalinarum]|uniref:Alpha/beta hydrolase n=1 Tax=Halobacillus shinanisalinarum TaxID=2932258 RepID=A0ABY4GUT6_9BACI|nr:alpha/beta hydrolase [Halobacillus shinanisalinarum]UOQ91716.1 alpha/beta hydrolase [Halobacillus shinanisalinarum]
MPAYHVEKVGQGEPLVFLPAGGFTGNEGMNIAEYLQDDYEIHMIDLPGFGRGKKHAGRCTSLDMAKWLADYLDQEGIKVTNLVGHSLGGALTLAFAVHFPERVKKLLLLDQGHKSFPRIPTSEYGVFAFAFPLMNRFVQLFGRTFLKRLEPLFSGGNADEDFEMKVSQFCDQVLIKDTSYVRTALKQPSSLTAEGLQLMFGFYNLNILKLLKKVTVPTYLAYGSFENINEKERKITYKNIRKLKRKALPIEYRKVRGGHYVHWSDPTLLPDMKAFLERRGKEDEATTTSNRISETVY